MFIIIVMTKKVLFYFSLNLTKLFLRLNLTQKCKGQMLDIAYIYKCKVMVNFLSWVQIILYVQLGVYIYTSLKIQDIYA